MATAPDIAKFIIGQFQSNGTPINNLKLQKLLYYSQAWHLALKDSPLFNERIEAWIHGPVIPPVFQEYKSFRWSPIVIEDVSIQFAQKAQAHVEEVLAQYGRFSSWDLERMTHNEDPWKIARGGLPPDISCTNLITHDSMKKFYSKQ
jgi:uncharacterized phage-associated protein